MDLFLHEPSLWESWLRGAAMMVGGLMVATAWAGAYWYLTREPEEPEQQLRDHRPPRRGRM